MKARLYRIGLHVLSFCYCLSLLRLPSLTYTVAGILRELRGA